MLDGTTAGKGADLLAVLEIAGVAADVAVGAFFTGVGFKTAAGRLAGSFALLRCTVPP